MKIYLSAFLLLFILTCARAENGYNLWLRYDKITNKTLNKAYINTIDHVIFPAASPVLRSAKKEFLNGLQGLLDWKPDQGKKSGNHSLIIGTPVSSNYIKTKRFKSLLKRSGSEGYFIKSVDFKNKSQLVIGANTDLGVLYGVFHLLRLMQTHQALNNLNLSEQPAIKCRILDHWDNLNGSVERGYAGSSIWKWQDLPLKIDPRYLDYARANASIGINGTVLNNVNANSLSLSQSYLVKTAALANVFRRYGIKIYLTAKFDAPIELGGLKTADPLDPSVKQWWADKADEIYRLIPDFGGFLVKANSEGQPGPQTYGRTHADGANMLADALAPHHGIVMWRAFVYDNNVPDDRAKQAYNEFKPLNGKFRKNVIIQVKNGPIDFQPREPFHPLFGAMPQTALMPEFQLTQEYLGFSTHLVYEAPLIKECLDADTYSAGSGTLVRNIITEKTNRHTLTGIAGVSNIGTDLNWCGHPFAQANWYAFGRLAWNPAQAAAVIAKDWLKMTFANETGFINPVAGFMLQSRENTVNYMTPLGLHHLMATSTHHGPGPWVDNTGRADWNPVYYHKADTGGIGFDRSVTGSNAVSQYSLAVRDQFNDLQSCPDIYLLWFHHLPWKYQMRSGRTLWRELIDHYYAGVDSVRLMQATWNKMNGYIDKERFSQVQQLISIQLEESICWRDACVQYFQNFSGMPIPESYERPLHPLSYYKQ